MSGSEESRFFECGFVRYELSDSNSRQGSFAVCAPFCVVQAVTPLLLGSGFIDDFRLHNPVVAWFPPLQGQAFRPEVRAQYPEVSDLVHSHIRKSILRVLNEFSDYSQAMVDPTELIPMLPIGTYVEFRYRFEIDKIAAMIEAMEGVHVSGVAELRFALAEVLAFTLTQDAA